MFCSCWRGFYLITSLESSTSIRAPVGALHKSRLVDYSVCKMKKRAVPTYLSRFVSVFVLKSTKKWGT